MAKESIRAKVLELLTKVDPELVAELSASSFIQDALILSEADLPDVSEDNQLYNTNLGVVLDMKNPSNMIEFFNAHPQAPLGWEINL